MDESESLDDRPEGWVELPASVQALIRHRHALLLQGPMGPFFDVLSRWLRRRGLQVSKVNLNGGDRFYYHQPDAVDYVEGLDGWPAWLSEHIRALNVDVIVLFGQARPFHLKARAVADELGVPVYVCEEGYQRPNYVTIEMEGVNGDSLIPRNPAFYRTLPRLRRPRAKPVHASVWRMYLQATGYGLGFYLFHRRFRRNDYHRSLPIWGECYRWLVRSWVSKYRCAWAERGMLQRLCAPARKGRWYLVPLQVHNDSQIHYHSKYGSVDAFIDEVIENFARCAPEDHWLVLKHHPLDRAYKHYGVLIADCARKYGVAERVFYIHDQHLPTLLGATRGVVTINSTVGMQALHRSVPVMATGECLYAIEGLTHQGKLDDFWDNPSPVDAALYKKFRDYLVHATQLNGSFYADIPPFAEDASPVIVVKRNGPFREMRDIVCELHLARPKASANDSRILQLLPEAIPFTVAPAEPRVRRRAS